MNAQPCPPLDEHPLDRVIWGALTSSHAPLAQGDGPARRYPALIGPLAGLRDRSPASYAALAALVPPGDAVGLLDLEPIEPPPPFTVLQRDRVDQMLLTGPLPPIPAMDLVPLGPADMPAMMALTALTHPGPFKHGTHELGSFLGMRLDGQLIAMTGERMRLPGFTEVSAVCVHPGHRGRGYAAALVAAVAGAIVGRDEVPFLHVRSDNEGAIALYLKLGFQWRRTFHFAVLGCAEA